MWKGRAVLSFQFQMCSSFRACAVELAPVSPTCVGGKDSGALFTHTRVAVGETWCHPVSLPCCSFGRKPWKRLQPEGIVSQKRYPFVFIRKGRASGNGYVILVHCTSAFGVAVGCWRSQTEQEACSGVCSLLPEHLNPS